MFSLIVISTEFICTLRDIISEKLPFTMIVHGGPFVVNMAEKEYAWVVEAILNKLPGNFVVKTSVVDWNTLTAKRMIQQTQALHNQLNLIPSTII